jgi:hypothetical protein
LAAPSTFWILAAGMVLGLLDVQLLEGVAVLGGSKPLLHVGSSVREALTERIVSFAALDLQVPVTSGAALASLSVHDIWVGG